MRRTTITSAVLFLTAALFLEACGGPAAAPVPEESGTAAQPTAAIANPASENCVKQGGMLFIRQRGDGGEYGMCLFEDNRQCEEWALLRGDCPVGGRKITGYVTDAATYCAITGGEYAVTGQGDPEQGTCTFKNGKTCDVWDYYNGKCDPITEQESYSDPFAYCAAVGNVDAPDGRYNGPEMPEAIIQGMIEQGVVSAEAPAEIQKAAVWRCMDGQVWVCAFGANLPCQEKADTSGVASTEMNDFCAANPTAEVIPAAVTGRAIVFEWKCNAGKPETVRQVAQVDGQGFLADFWYLLPPE